jgi:hypothetical protein
MDLDKTLQACTAIICTYADRRPLQEFEQLAYEQACRTLESVLKDFRKFWEVTDEAENYS